MAQSIVAYVDERLDTAQMGPVHYRVLALITFGYFFDVIDYIILGSLVPDMVRSHFATAAEIGSIGAVTIFGLFVGALGQGELTDRFGRKAVFQGAVLLYGLATIAVAQAPDARCRSSPRKCSRRTRAPRALASRKAAGDWAPPSPSTRSAS